MANDSRPSLKVKDDENNNAKEIAGKPSTGSSAETSKAFGLRRSVREISKKNMSPSPSSIRKSERLEKRAPTPPSMRKSERVEKQILPSSLRRSERGKKQSSSSSSGSKKSNKSLGLSVIKKKLKKAKSVKQLTIETDEMSKSQKHVTEPVQVGKKRMDARAYRALFKQQQEEVNVAAHSKERNKDDKLSSECINNEGNASKSVDKGKEYGQKKPQESREVSAGRDSGKTLEESDHSVSKPPISESNPGLESSNSSQNHRSVGEAHRSEDGDSVEDSKGGDNALFSAHKKMSRKLDIIADMEKKKLHSELVNPMMNEGASNNDVESESGFKEMSLKWKRNKIDIDSDATAMASRKDICSSAAGASLPERANGADVTTRVAEKCIINLQHRDAPADFQLDGGQNACLVCKLGGKLLCCEGRGCKRSYHLHCLDPPLKDVPLGVWYCLCCVRKKIKLGAPSVSEGIESIWQQLESEENGLQKDFFVKYKGLSHVHNRWVSETQLLLEAPSLVAKFNRKNQVSKWKQEWIEPHRMLQKRLLESPKQHNEFCGRGVDDDLNCRYEWLVKWRGLDYKQASWELETASFMKSPNTQKLMRDYENRLERAKKGHSLSRIYKELEMVRGSVKSNQMSTGSIIEFDNNHLDFVNNLRGQWLKGQNVIVIDDQERIMKVIAFITSFSSNECWPFLIITSSAAFRSWDEEFFQLAPSIDAVIYHGCKGARREIRTVEFYVEGDAVMFDVLITSPEVIAEDLDLLDSIKWEAVIVDECQRSRIYSHSDKIRCLNTEMRLLLFNGQLKDGIIEHLLSLLDCESDIAGSEDLVTNADHRISNLKEKLSKYIVNSSKSETSRFVEYWVPVQMSNAQLEQYCANLLSNSLLLCSSSKNDLVGALRDVIISNRKCCDHPYIMDPLLPKSLTEDFKVANALDVEIKASGKLRLLDLMLFEIRNRGLRVLILFQSSGGSGKVKIGDILDDFLRLRFGQDSYERVEGSVSSAKKTAALNNFNNQKSRFVFLLETRACLPSIKLSSVDTVIIYSSDWSPANDLRSLQKITLDTQFEQLRIFRLYSSFTVEENVLILAKQDKTLDSNLQGINRATSHSLLMCGASYLFNKLDEFHSGCALATCRSTSFESVSHEDIVQEFLTILPQNAKENNSSNSSIILKAKQNQGNYSTEFPLPGEQKIQSSDAAVPHIFWKKLLNGKQPQWKYSSCLSQWNRKRGQHFDDVHKKPESEGEEVAKKRKKVGNNDFVRTSMKSAVYKGNMVSAGNEGNIGAASHNVHRLMSGSTSHLNSSHANNALTSSSLANNKPDVPTVNLAKSSERTNLRDSQKGLHVLLKPEIAKLCEILKLPEDVKAMAQSFLEYVINNHCVIREPATILQAFHISLCWTAASLLKYKLDHKESFALAKQHLNFGCKKEEADYVYSMLRCLKKMFLYHKGNRTPACSLKTSESSIEVANKDHNVKSSLSTPSSLQKLKVELEDLAHGQKSFDDPVLSQLGQQDFSRSIKDIQKKCDRHMIKLLQKQHEEIEECKRKYESEKAELEKKQKAAAAVIRLHSNSSMRTNKLKLLNTEYEMKFEELKHQMEIRCKELEEMHMAARKKLEERKEIWVKGVISWANMGLINKPASNETGNSHRNAHSLSSHLKKQNFENFIEDGVAPVVVPVGSSDDEENTVKLSSNEQSSNKATSTVPNKKLPMELPENANSTGGSDNMRKPKTALPKAMDDGIAITGEKDCCPAMPTDDAIQLNQQNGVMCIINQDNYSIMTAGSRAAKSASDNVVEDGKVVENRTIDNGISDSSDKTTGVGQQDEETQSGVPETTAGVVKGNETSKQQDGKVQEVELVDNRGPESLGEPARVNQQVMDLRQTNGEVVEDVSTGEETNGVCVMASNVDNHLQELSGALQELYLQQTTSTGLERVEPPVHHQDHDVASNQTTEERELQMPSIDSVSLPNSMDLPSSSETEHQFRYEGDTTIEIAESSIDFLEGQTEHSNVAISQPVTPVLHHLPAEIPIVGSGMHVSDTRSVSTSSGVNNHPVQTLPPVRVPPLPLCHDPLQNELERIRKERDQIITIHEDTKLRLKSECEKEIEEVVAEIRRKYESKYQAMELEFLLKKKELDTNHSKVLMNKILAEAFRSKCMDVRASSSPDIQQDVPSSFMQQLLQLSSLPPAQRNTIGSGLSSAGPAAGGPQIAIPSSHSTAPSIHSTAPVSGNFTRPPVINSIHPAAGNFQMACGIRAPAPHLQPFRSAASAMVTNTSHLTVGTASPQVPGNLPTTSAAPSQLQLRPQPPTEQSHPHDIGHQSEASGIMPPLSSSAAAILESLMDIDNQRNSGSPHSNPRNLHLDSNTDAVILSELRPQNDTRTTVTSQGEVVCLSDDD